MGHGYPGYSRRRDIPGLGGGIPLGFGAGEAGELDVFSGSGKWLKSEKRYRGINAKARRCGDAKPERDEFG